MDGKISIKVPRINANRRKMTEKEALKEREGEITSSRKEAARGRNGTKQNRVEANMTAIYKEWYAELA